MICQTNKWAHAHVKRDEAERLQLARHVDVRVFRNLLQVGVNAVNRRRKPLGTDRFERGLDDEEPPECGLCFRNVTFTPKGSIVAHVYACL